MRRAGPSNSRFWSYSGHRPGSLIRRRDRAFLELVGGLIPITLLRTRKGHVPAFDRLVRIDTSGFKDAQAPSDESRRRGLIETHRCSAKEN